MTTSTALWDAIRRGESPTASTVAGVAAADGAFLGSHGVARIRHELAATVLGLGPVEPLTADPAVTDIVINGDGSVWVDRGNGVEATAVSLAGGDAVRELAVRLAALARRRLDEASPFVDGQLPSGIRLHAIVPPLVAGGAHISLRIPARRPLTLAEIVARGGLDAAAADVLRQLVRAGISFLVTGGTGTGKTTLLAAMLNELPSHERLVVVEDVLELAIGHRQTVRLQARPPNVEGIGEVSMTALVRQALRMRPDRLVVGEVRGAEVRELLAALNTGHDGGCGTIHANSSHDVVARLEALGALAGMSPYAVRSQVVSAVQAVVHLRRHAGIRRVDEIAVLPRRWDSGEVVVRPALARCSPQGPLQRAEAWPDLVGLLELRSPGAGVLRLDQPEDRGAGSPPAGAGP